MQYTRSLIFLITGILITNGLFHSGVMIFPLSLTWEFRTDVLVQDSHGAVGRVVLPVYHGDLDRDGQNEQVVVDQGQAWIYHSGQVMWHSSSDWNVIDAQVTDLNHDQQLEVTLLVWRAFQPWPVDRFLPHGGRIAGHQDANGQSCQLVLISWRREAFRELWVGSALARPILSFRSADLDGDTRQELVVLEGEYLETAGSSNPRWPARSLAVWQWSGFGFNLLTRQTGFFGTLSIMTRLSDKYQIVMDP